MAARREKAARGELILKNDAGVPVSVRYRGHYGTRQFDLEPAATRSLAFHAADLIAVEAAYQGLVLSTESRVFGDSGFANTPGRVLGEIMIMRTAEGVRYNLHGPGIETEPPGVLGTNIEVYFRPHLP